MTKITPEFLRSALTTMRAGQMLDANRLVQQTLAQHGLAGGPDGVVAGTPVVGRGPRAPLDRDRFTCAAGSRDYVLHLPKAMASPPRGLVLMLHGCTQTPEDFALGTGMTAKAHAAGLAVVYAAQSRGDNAQSCWNWFSGADQKRGAGEPAILAGMVREIAATHSIAQDAVFVAGLSAGGAMAVILGRTYPEVFAGVGVHSGLPYASAKGMAEAFAAMAGQTARKAGKPAGKLVPTIVFHGEGDTTVVPANGEKILADALGTSGQITQSLDRGVVAGRAYRCTTALTDKGHMLAEHWQIEGLGHAWSGGNPAGSHADARGPDASAQMLRFFASLPG